MHKLFIVDKDSAEREALEKILMQHFKDIEIAGTAASGFAAVNGINESDPEIIIMDINIPELNGIEVVRQVKKHSPEKKFILLTAYCEFEYAQQAIKVKADDLLLKPIVPEQLVESVTEAIEDYGKDNKVNFDEKMNEIIYAVIQKKYNDARIAVSEYVDLLYDYYEHDLLATQKEIARFVGELHNISMDLCRYSLKHFRDEKMNQQYFINHYQNRYDLKVEIMNVIDRIFDRFLDTSNRKNNIDDIINFIDRNAHKDISLDLVGEYANMSSYYLSKIFKKATGKNFVTYMTERKVEMAKDMLVNTEEPIINIAINLSYHEPNYFSKVFKKSTGMTPTEYRKKYK